VAYERLCHFEDYPQFMSGVQQVTQLSENMAHWVMDLGGAQTEFNARITERRPGELLAWQAVDGPKLAEKVTFQELSDDRCRIIAELDIDAKQLMPNDRHANESLNKRLKADLTGLKEYVEQGGIAGYDGGILGYGGDASGAGAGMAGSGTIGSGTIGSGTTGSGTATTGRHAASLDDAAFAEYDDEF
jgi:ribosome-associated toxin RatA of RatAB toxin-antitoxin module